MKLTLRTLLAYIDNLLPPQDAEEFEALLSKNEAANNLCNRIRSVMTRPELGAPEVLDKGLHLDPNVTAEYLDNVLSSEESPEYERLCISSDRQLGEVSACHQILTVVQIEPAEVDPSWREKIYTAPEHVSNEESVDLGSALDEPAPASGGGFMASLSGILSGASGILGGGQSLKLNLDRKAAPAPAEKKEPPIPEPPEPVTPPAFQNTAPLPPEPPMEPPADNQSNIANPQAALEQYAQMITPEMGTQEKPRQSSLTWILSLAAMAALIILFVVLFMGPRNKRPTEVADNNNTASSEETKPADSAAASEEKPVASKDETANAPSDETTPAPSTDAKETANADAQTEPADAAPDAELSPIEPIDEQPETPADATEDLPTLKNDETPAPATETESNLDSLPGLEETDADNDVDNAPGANDDASVDTELDNNLTADDVPPTGEAPAEENAEDNSLELFDDAPQKMVELGQFVKRKGVDPQILAFKAKGSETWRRMSENASIRSGDTLLAFPDYRPDVNLGADVRLRLVGPARVLISPKSTPDEIQLTLEYGRLILVTSKAFSKKIVIKCATLPTILEINQPSVKVAFEADVLKPEGDPAVAPANFYGTISLLLGKANQMYKGALNSVDSPTFIDCLSGAVNPQGAAADWIQNETPATADFEKRLTGDKPIGITLSEIIDSKTISKELRQTVLVSLSMVGQYSTLVEDFNKEDRFGVWMDEFIVLQDSILKSQANAQTALDELKKRYDANGERIYEILWKYHNDLSSEDMNALITDLRDETLCVRVAAYCLLKSRGVNLGAYKPNDLKKSETTLKALESKYKASSEF